MAGLSCIIITRRKRTTTKDDNDGGDDDDDDEDDGDGDDDNNDDNDDDDHDDDDDDNDDDNDDDDDDEMGPTSYTTGNNSKTALTSQPKRKRIPSNPEPVCIIHVPGLKYGPQQCLSKAKDPDEKMEKLKERSSVEGWQNLPKRQIKWKCHVQACRQFWKKPMAITENIISVLQ
ncbi:nucleophosmin-like [Haliotis cracherodii]|uniref:nucleophosmin-like n=1 Tax=Haliotis cracherodii TaxID=6455 RepID=UPI0039EB7B3D